MVGFEPTVSCARSTRISRLSYTLIFIHRGSTFPFGISVPRGQKSTQRESNPHFRPGEAAGCRSIMGAKTLAELPKSKTLRAPGGTRTHVSALRVRSPGRWTMRCLQYFSGIGRARTVTNRVRTGCAASLTPRSQMDAFNEVGGIQTPAARVKSSLCCRYTTTPCVVAVSVSAAAVRT